MADSFLNLVKRLVSILPSDWNKVTFLYSLENVL